MSDFTLNGRHVAAIFVSAFSIIFAVNMLLAFSAVRTFPGLEVKNSYVASQSFDARRAAQNALNWEVAASIEGQVLTLTIDDANGPVAAQIVQATLGRATHVRDDLQLAFLHDGKAFTAPLPKLEHGYWNLRLKAVSADGVEFSQRISLRVAP
ncbi:MAG: FixH family protein [Paracoccaceae bacterium]